MQRKMTHSKPHSDSRSQLWFAKYALHFNYKNQNPFPEGSKIQVIPLIDEQYFSLPIGTEVASYTDRRSVEKHVYENLCFVGS